MKKVLIVLSALFAFNVFAQVDVTKNTVDNSRYVERLKIETGCWYWKNKRWQRSACNTLSEITCLGKQAEVLRSVLSSQTEFILDYRIEKVELFLGSPSHRQHKRFFVHDDPILRVEVPFTWGTNKCDVLSAEEMYQSINEIYRYN